MYQVSDAFSQLIKEDSRTFKALISIDDTIITSVLIVEMISRLDLPFLNILR